MSLSSYEAAMAENIGLREQITELQHQLEEAKQDTKDVYADYQDAVLWLHKAEAQLAAMREALRHTLGGSHIIGSKGCADCREAKQLLTNPSTAAGKKL